MVLEGGRATAKDALCPRILATALADDLVLMGKGGYVMDCFCGSGVVADEVRKLGASTIELDKSRCSDHEVCAPAFSRL